MSYATSGLAGANFVRRTTAPDFSVGTICQGNDNSAWVYVLSSGTVAIGTCTVSSSNVVTDTAGAHTADTAFAASEYGWVRQTLAATNAVS